MRKVAKDLCKELGNSSVLTKVVQVPTDYDPATGKSTATSTTDYDIYTAQNSKMSGMFPLDGQNTNLEGFKEGGYIIPWFGQMIDTTWLFDGQNITSVSEIKSQNDIIVFTIGVGEKP